MHKGRVWAYNCSSFSLPSRNLMPAEDLDLKSAASSSLSFFRRFCDHSCARHMHHQTNIKALSRYPVNHSVVQQSTTCALSPDCCSSNGKKKLQESIFL